MRRLSDPTRHHKPNRRFVVILISDRVAGSDLAQTVPSLPKGSLLLIRDYDHPARAAYAAQLAGLCRRHRIHPVIAGDFALAVRLRCGLHLPDRPRTDLSRIRLWHRRKPGRWLTMASHDPGGLDRARRLGADFALLSPIFPTASHPGAKPLGVLRLRQWSRRSRQPVIALGGVTAARVRQLRRCRLAGIATIRGYSARSSSSSRMVRPRRE